MEKEIFLFLVALSITTHIVRLVYEILKHKKVIKASKLTFVIVFINMALLWISWFALCVYDIYRIDVPDILRYSGILLVATGILIFFIALFTIKTLESYEGDLITRGIYSKIRHPMYLGFIFWLIGFPLFNGALFSVVLSVVFIANVLFWRSLEEKELAQRYPSYKQYKSTTFF